MSKNHCKMAEDKKTSSNQFPSKPLTKPKSLIQRLGEGVKKRFTGNRLNSKSLINIQRKARQESTTTACKKMTIFDKIFTGKKNIGAIELDAKAKKEKKADQVIDSEKSKESDNASPKTLPKTDDIQELIREIVEAKDEQKAQDVKDQNQLLSGQAQEPDKEKPNSNPEISEPNVDQQKLGSSTSYESNSNIEFQRASDAPENLIPFPASTTLTGIFGKMTAITSKKSTLSSISTNQAPTNHLVPGPEISKPKEIPADQRDTASKLVRTKAWKEPVQDTVRPDTPIPNAFTEETLEETPEEAHLQNTLKDFDSTGAVCSFKADQSPSPEKVNVYNLAKNRISALNRGKVNGKMILTLADLVEAESQSNSKSAVTFRDNCEPMEKRPRSVQSFHSNCHIYKAKSNAKRYHDLKPYGTRRSDFTRSSSNTGHSRGGSQEHGSRSVNVEYGSMYCSVSNGTFAGSAVKMNGCHISTCVQSNTKINVHMQVKLSAGYDSTTYTPDFGQNGQNDRQFCIAENGLKENIHPQLKRTATESTQGSAKRVKSENSKGCLIGFEQLMANPGIHVDLKRTLSGKRRYQLLNPPK